MAGHLGDERVTTQNLVVVRADVEQGLLYVRGAVPGAKNGWVMVRDAAKGTGKEGLPFPASLKGAAAGQPEQKEG